MGAASSGLGQKFKIMLQYDKKLIPLLLPPIIFLIATGNSEAKTRISYTENPLIPLIKSKKEKGSYNEDVAKIPYGRYV